MTRSGFTLAPWNIERKESSGFIESIGPCMAYGCARSVWLEVSEEDARLIPSAPNLYEKLDQLVAVVGLTAFKYEGQRAVLQEAVDEALSVLREVEHTL